MQTGLSRLIVSQICDTVKYSVHILHKVIWASTRENLSSVFVNNKGTVNNKGADLFSLISSFVICLLKSVISKLATSKFYVFYLVSVAEETGLSLPLRKTPKTGLSCRCPYMKVPIQINFV